MKSIKIAALPFACFIAPGVVDTPPPVSLRASVPLRNFEFTCITKIPALPADVKISRIWIPVPQSDSCQTISDLRIQTAFPYVTQRDAEYGNEYLYLQIPATSVVEPTEVSIHFHAARQEHRVTLGAQRAPAPASVPPVLQPWEKSACGVARSNLSML